jgi:hypothetical protein
MSLEKSSQPCEAWQKPAMRSLAKVCLAKLGQSLPSAAMVGSLEGTLNERKITTFSFRLNDRQMPPIYFEAPPLNHHHGIPEYERSGCD